jgi:hypothetical protein
MNRLHENGYHPGNYDDHSKQWPRRGWRRRIELDWGIQIDRCHAKDEST